MHRDTAAVVMAAIAHVRVHFAHLVTDQVIDLFHLLGQRVAIIGVSCEALRAYEPSATTAHRDTDLVAELILLACLALGDAFDFGLVNRVDLILVVPLLCVDPMRRIQ